MDKVGTLAQPLAGRSAGGRAVRRAPLSVQECQNAPQPLRP
ncbi:hypothetical protein [Hyalangium minutum]|uniref:Uncharacterized protein n=1 Tax=Hyalangium minutum TaxID=394096 RepID=A0A085WK41_9BACT|nr:hypothetical protein [Hyalangium minutum]KFE68054.1 hypothetical protein DB31_7291 [Hyalangium minutum]